MRIDYHVHTYYSDDSKYPMEEVVKDAIKLKIDEICFTDHVDYGIKNDVDDPVKTPCQNVDYEKYFKEIEYLKQKYPDIRIKKGLEFGIQRHTADKFDKLFNRYPLDFVILSCHQTDDKEFWTQDYQKGKSQKEYNLGYYNEIYEVMKVYKNYSVLGHLDHIVRYDDPADNALHDTAQLISAFYERARDGNKAFARRESEHLSIRFRALHRVHRIEGRSARILSLEIFYRRLGAVFILGDYILQALTESRLERNGIFFIRRYELRERTVQRDPAAVSARYFPLRIFRDDETYRAGKSLQKLLHAHEILYFVLSL